MGCCTSVVAHELPERSVRHVRRPEKLKKKWGLGKCAMGIFRWACNSCPSWRSCQQARISSKRSVICEAVQARADLQRGLAAWDKFAEVPQAQASDGSQGSWHETDLVAV